MGLVIADGFSYKAKKPLDERVMVETLVDLLAMPEYTVYDGIIVYVKEEKKYYTYDSTNPVDTDLQKWTELKTGGGDGNAKLEEYAQNKNYKKDSLVIFNNKLYLVITDFVSDSTAATAKESFQLDIDNNNLIAIDTDTDTNSSEYTIGNEYKKGTLLVKDAKLYLTTIDFTAVDFEAEITAETIVPVNVDTDTDTHAYEYKIGEEYKTNNLLVRNEKVYLVLNNFTATNFDTELANKDFIPVDSDLDTHSIVYGQGQEYNKGNLIVYNTKLYIALQDFTSDNTEATEADSFVTDLTNNYLVAVDIDTDTLGCVEYRRGNTYKKDQMVICDGYVAWVKQDFTASNIDTDKHNDFNTDVKAGKIVVINHYTLLNVDATYITKWNEEITISFDYPEFMTSYSTGYGNIVYVIDSSTNTLVGITFVVDSSQYDFANKTLTATFRKLGENGGGDASLTEKVTSNLAVGNIKVGDVFEAETSFTDFVKKLLIKEILPSATFNAANSGLKLKGTTVTAPKLTTTITLGSGTIQKVEFYRNSALEDTQNYVNGTNNYEYNTTDIDVDTIVGVKIYYTQSDGITTGILNYTKNYKFMNYSYCGVSDDIPTVTDIVTYTPTLKDVKTYNIVLSPADQHIVYAYPASLGTLTSIKDQNNFEYIGSYTLITLTVNNETYNVYYLTDKVTANEITQKFN